MNEAKKIAQHLAAVPQASMRADRRSAKAQWSLNFEKALKAEYEGGVKVIAAGESQAGAQRFVKGTGRHGQS